MADARPAAWSTRYIHRLAVDRPEPMETLAAARERIGPRLPRPSVRRMTHLGLLLGSVLDGITLGADDAIVYATTYSETRALEDFLGSFPSASPAQFQASIHPSGIQQVVVGRQQPVARLWPLAGQERLVEQALLTALLEPAARVVMAGGEERGTWMLGHGMASDRPFAFALELTRDGADAIGEIAFAPGLPANSGGGLAPGPGLLEFTGILEARHSLTWKGEGGMFACTFR